MPIGVFIFLVVILLVLIAVLVNAFRAGPRIRPPLVNVPRYDIPPDTSPPLEVPPAAPVLNRAAAPVKSAGLIEAERRAAAGVFAVEEGMSGAGLGPSDSSLMQRRQLDFSSLGRQATEAKKSGDMKQAIELLLEQRRVAESAGFKPEAETLLRLPLYLQAAGRFAEAVEEFGRLLSMADLAYKVAGDEACSPARKIYSAAIWRAKVYDKMRLAYSRQGDPAGADEYAELHRSEVETGFAIRSVIELERDEESNRAKKRLAQLTGRT